MRTTHYVQVMLFRDVKNARKSIHEQLLDILKIRDLEIRIAKKHKFEFGDVDVRALNELRDSYSPEKLEILKSYIGYHLNEERYEPGENESFLVQSLDVVCDLLNLPKS